jgi:hypothetical protein
MKTSLGGCFGNVQRPADFLDRRTLHQPHPDGFLQTRSKLADCAQYLGATLTQIVVLLWIRGGILDFEREYSSKVIGAKIKQYLGTISPFAKYQQRGVDGNAG